MSETPVSTATDAPGSANGAGPMPETLAETAAAVVGPTERVMFVVMLLAGAGLLFLAVDGLTGYGLTRAIGAALGRSDDTEGG